MGVTFSELGVDRSGDRSSMPSEAMSFLLRAVRDDGTGRLLAAPSLHSARSSSRWLVVGAELLRSSSAGDGSLEEGGAARCCPPPSDMALGMGRSVHRLHGAEHCI